MGQDREKLAVDLVLAYVKAVEVAEDTSTFSGPKQETLDHFKQSWILG